MALRQKRARIRAARHPHTVADMTADELREMIEELIDRKLAELAPASAGGIPRWITASMRQRAMSAAGRYHSGHSDISIDHDKHLAESYGA